MHHATRGHRAIKFASSALISVALAAVLAPFAPTLLAQANAGGEEALPQQQVQASSYPQQGPLEQPSKKSAKAAKGSGEIVGPRIYDIWDGTSDVSWYNSTDTTFTISTSAQLAGLAEVVNGTAKTSDGTAIAADSFKGKTVKLGSDLSLNNANIIAADPSLTNWIPIGNINTENGSTADISFDGTFDGQGHDISGLYINGNVTSPNTRGGYQGLFGALGADAVIENFGVTNGWVSGGVSGAVAAVSATGDIEKEPTIVGVKSEVVVVGNTSGHQGVGGIFGGADESATTSSGQTLYRGACYIANCYVDPVLENQEGSSVSNSSTGPVGGIAGVGSVQVYACYAMDSITAGVSTVNPSAIVGELYGKGYPLSGIEQTGEGDIHDCYAPQGYSSQCYVLFTKSGDAVASEAVSQTDDVMFVPEINLSISTFAIFLSSSYVPQYYYDTPKLYWEESAKTIDFDNAHATLGSIEDQRYTGEEVTPEVPITADTPFGAETESTVTLHQGSDYRVAYSDNVEVGTAKAKVTPFGRYTGSDKDTTFNIVQRNLADAKVSAVEAQWMFHDADGNAIGVEPAVKVVAKDGTELVEGTDYTVSYSNNTLADGVEKGTGTVVVSPAGTSTIGNATQDFTILNTPKTLSGSGTEADPYLLQSKGDVELFAHKLNAVHDTGYSKAFYKVTADLDLTSKDPTFMTDRAADPISTSAANDSASGAYATFGGTLDGDGHTITLGLTEGSPSVDSGFSSSDTLAFISRTYYEGTMTVKNLTVAGSVNSDSKECSAAGFVGSCTMDKIVMENCVNKANVVTMNDRAAGLLDSASWHTEISFKDCKNEGRIKSESRSGGLVNSFSMQNEGTLSFENCSNSGAISSGERSGETGYAAGIVAWADPSTDGKATIVFKDCSNTGDIDIKTSRTTGYAAGIAGAMDGSTASSRFIRCSNAGDVTSSSSAYLGGITASLSSNATVFAAYNTGDIKMGGSTRYGNSAGGFIGDIKNGVSVQFLNAYNAGKVTVAGDYADANLDGAIFGIARGNNTIGLGNVYFASDSNKNCYGAMNSWGATPSGTAVEKTAEEMKEASFVTALGGSFAADQKDADGNFSNGGFPVFGTSETTPTLSSCGIAGIADQSYQLGNEIKPAVTVYAPDGSILTDDQYTVAYENNKEIGTATVTVTATEGATYSGSLSATFNIVRTSLGFTNSDVSIDDIAAQKYTGKPIEPEVTVHVGDVTLVKDRDYTVKYSYNTDVSTSAMITITGIGNFKDEATKFFEITAPSMDELTFEDIPDQTYTGSSLRPDPVITYNGTRLKMQTYESEGTDYYIDYENNENVGEATATIHFWHNFTGEKTMTFKIVPADASGFEVEPVAHQTYTGYNVTPEPEVTFNGQALSKDKDYTVNYRDNTNAGTAKMHLVGTGNFTGSKDVEFVIDPADIAAVEAKPIADQFYTGDALEPSIELSFDSNPLVAGTDYETSYRNNTEIGEATMVVSGLGNFRSYKEYKFNIVTNSIENTTISEIPDQLFTGSAITPHVTVKVGKRILSEGDDYTVEYSDNVEVGTATVTVTGKNGFTGSKTASFKIVSGDLANAQIEAIGAKTYTGSAIEPHPTVKLHGIELVSGKDYEVSYKDNVNAGYATLVVKGLGNYSGSTSRPFQIVAASLEDAQMSVASKATYTGKAVKPAATVTLGKVKLVSGKDFNVRYQNNVKLGTAQVTVTGTGNYKGVLSKSFKIVAPKVAKVKGFKVKTAKKASSGAKKGVLKLSWKKAKNVSGFQIRYRVGSKGKWKTLNVKKGKAKKATLKKLNKGKKYQVKIRAYKKAGSKTFYSKYSKKVMSKKVK